MNSSERQLLLNFASHPCMEESITELDFEVSTCKCCGDMNASQLTLAPVAGHRGPAVVKKRAGTLNRNLLPKGLKRFTDGPLPTQPVCEQMSDLVLCVLAMNPNNFTLNGTNTYLVGTGPKRILIDTGEDGPNAIKYLKELKQVMRERSIVGFESIICTHLHYDHIGGVKMLLAEFGDCPVLKYPTPEDDIQRRKQIVAESRARNNGKVEMQCMPAYLVDRFEETVPYQHLHHLEVIQTQGATLTVHYTPGHASDHVVLVLEEENRMFSGDHVLGWGSSWVFNLKQYMDTLDYMLGLKPDSIYPGHGPFIEDGCGRIQQYIDHRQAREDQIVELLKRHYDERISNNNNQDSGIIGDGMSSGDIISVLYSSVTKTQFESAVTNVLKVLDKLKEEGKVIAVEPTGEKYKNEETNDGDKDPGVATEDYKMIWYLSEDFVNELNSKCSQVGDDNDAPVYQSNL